MREDFLTADVVEEGNRAEGLLSSVMFGDVRHQMIALRRFAAEKVRLAKKFLLCLKPSWLLVLGVWLSLL